MSPFQKIAIALTLGVLCCIKEVQTYSDELNRFYNNWSLTDSVAMLLGILLLGASFFCLHVFLVRKFPSLKRVEIAAIVFIVAQALVTYFWPANFSQKAKLVYLIAIWVPVLILMIYALAKPAAAVFRLITTVVLVFSPIVLILGYNIFNWSRWPSPAEKFSASQEASAGDHPVFIFFFDAWSARRSLDENGDLLAQFEHTRALAENSYFFTDANAPSHSTFPSIPNFLYFVEDSFPESKQRFLGRGDKGPEENLFGVARDAGYNAYLAGFKLPYRYIVGDAGGSVRTYTYDPNSDGLIGKVFCYLRNNFLFSKNPVSFIGKTVFYRFVFSAHWRDLNGEMLQDVDDVIDQSPSNSIGVFHLPLPHAPFIFDSKGNYKGPFEGHEPMGRSTAAYVEHLGYLDVTIGKIIEKLKQEGKYDDSLIIMTADHSWKEDSYSGDLEERISEVRKVPLLIKMPGQTERIKVTKEIDVLDIAKLLRQSLKAERGNRIELETLLN